MAIGPRKNISGLAPVAAPTPVEVTAPAPAPVVVVSEEVIARLEAIGGKRWTKDSYDRIYLDVCEDKKPCAMREACGIHGTRGGYTDLEDEKLSNNRVWGMLSGKVYVDLTSGKACAHDSYAAAALQAFMDS